MIKYVLAITILGQPAGYVFKDDGYDTLASCRHEKAIQYAENHTPIPGKMEMLRAEASWNRGQRGFTAMDVDYECVEVQVGPENDFTVAD